MPFNLHITLDLFSFDLHTHRSSTGVTVVCELQQIHLGFLLQQIGIIGANWELPQQLINEEQLETLFFSPYLGTVE